MKSIRLSSEKLFSKDIVPYLILCAILLIFVLYFSASRSWMIQDDIWEWAATINEVAKNPIHPDNPILDLPGNTSPRFVPHIVFWGVFQKLFHIDVYQTLVWMSVVHLLILCFGIYLFFSNYFVNKRMPFYVFLSMLFLWGTGFNWSNAYKFEVLVESTGLASTLSFALIFLGLYCLIRYFISFKSIFYILFFILGVSSFITHPITGTFYFLTSFVLCFEYFSWRHMIMVILVPTTTFFLIRLWPYFNHWDVLFIGTGSSWIDFTPLFENQITGLGLTFIGIPLVLYFLIHRKYPFIVLGFIASVAVYFACFVLGITIGDRYLFFLALFLHMAIGLFFYESGLLNFKMLKESFNTKKTSLLLFCIIVFLALGTRAVEMAYHLKYIIDRPMTIHKYESPVRQYEFLTHYLNDDNVVLCDSYTGWVVPAVTGAKLVAPHHPVPLILEEAQERLRDVDVFFNQSMSSEELINIVEKYHVSHVLTHSSNRVERGLEEFLTQMSNDIVHENEYKLYVFDESTNIK